MQNRSNSTITAAPDFLYRAGYMLAVTMFVLPLSDIALGLLPLQLDSMRWRVGATGLITGAALLPVAGLSLALTISHLRHHRALQYLLATTAVIGALLFMGAAGLFALDTLQLRHEVNPQRVKLYDRAALKGVLSQVLLVAVLLWMAVGSLRVSWRASRAERARRRDQRAVFVTPSTVILPTSSIEVPAQ